MRLQIWIVSLGLAALGCAGDPPTSSQPTPVPTVEVIGTVETVGYARIEWEVRDGMGLEFPVERQHIGQPWKVRAVLMPDASGRMTLEDATVSAGQSYAYRVRVPGADREYQGVVLVNVPS